MTLALNNLDYDHVDPDYDWVNVYRILTGRYPEARVQQRAERDDTIRGMLADGRTHKQIAAALHMPYGQVRILVACLTDDRVWQLNPHGRCDRCTDLRRVAAEWQITRPDGAKSEYCTRHAGEALAALDRAGVPGSVR